ncbi:FUSC family protein [Candidatus Saccharibacteria bacterium]|nr:MAG: FUSC family protein [Candidatus Saccharibacteria bacterium]
MSLVDKIKVDGKLTLMWTEAIRALVCMLPMLVYAAMGKTSFLVTLGQGGFFFSTLFLPKKMSGRLVMSSLILALGLGFYLIGGVVAPNPWLAVFFTFMVCLNLSFLSGWTIGGPLALTLVMIYTAGLNTGSPEKASANFMVFAFVLTWSALISLLPFWKPIEPPKVDTTQTNGALAEQGVRMAIGASLALAISYIAGFAKLGWAPSAVGSVIRYEKKLSRMRAVARLLGTVAGAFLSAVALAFITSPEVLVTVGAVFAVLNGLFKKTKLGMMPFFYTATILILYSANDLSLGGTHIVQRVLYNLVGISVAVLVVVYPFPKLMQKVNPKSDL